MKRNSRIPVNLSHLSVTRGNGSGHFIYKEMVEACSFSIRWDVSFANDGGFLVNTATKRTIRNCSERITVAVIS